MIKNILQLLEDSARKYPDNIAFADLKRKVKYKEFLTETKLVGSTLADMNCYNRPIAVFIDKTVNCLEAMMGVVYSGNFYTVIDVAMPKDRIDVIFSTLEPVAIVTDSKNLKKAQDLQFSGDVYVIEDMIEGEINDSALSNIRARAIDTDPVYALFTSGSTGVPKGTVICHRSVIDYAYWVTETFDITDKTIFGSQTPFYFSMSVLDVFSTIMAGATFYIIPKMYFSFPVKLVEYMNINKINTVYWVPSALCIVANLNVLDELELPYLKKVLFAGEVMPVKQLNTWISHMPKDVMFANLYGPTEITDICTYYIVDREFEDTETLPIGKPCNNCDVMIIKEDNTLAQKGEEGELCVRGSFLAMGYYNNPEKTQGVFTQNPLNPYYPELVYHTGDIVKLNERDEIIYMSRKDFQIKHMGYRIELGEIEAAVNAVEGIISCACIYDTVKSKIVLFYDSHVHDKKDILSGAAKKLPKYMCPNEIFKLDRMPHNANGKIDRVNLKNIYTNELQGE